MDAHCLETPDVSELISVILARREPLHDGGFAQAIRLADEVERTFSQRDDCPLGLADLLMLTADLLEEHQQKEEAVLFPALIRNDHAVVREPLRRMQSDHSELAGHIDAIRRLTNDFSPPTSAGGTWRELYRVCERLCAGLAEDLRLENEILFPRFC